MSPAPLLVFDRERGLLHLLADGATSWTAHNHAAMASRGIWLPGVYFAEALVEVGGDDGAPDGCFGPRFLRYAVTGRTGMGVHSGRRNVPDKLGRLGPAHATMGCIRTSDEAMEEIARAIRAAGGALPALWVAR